MDFGVALATPADAWKTAKQAEDLGFDSVWFFDTQQLSADIFTAMAVAAVKTDRVRLHTGVIVPSNRIAPVTANAFATLNALAPGRIHAGFGTGFSARLTLGLGPYKLKDMGHYISVVKGMLAGETVECEVEGQRKKVRFLNPEAGLINIEDEVPIHVSAFGPKGRRLTADLDAHWINVDFSDGFSGAQAAADEMDETYREAGVDPATKRKSIFMWGSVLRDGETADSDRVKAEVGPFAAQVIHAVVEGLDRGASAAPAQEDAAEDDSPLARAVPGYFEMYQGFEPADAKYLHLHKGHLLYVRPEEEPFITGELIASLTNTGTPDLLRERLRRVKDAGYDEIVVAITPGHESMIEDWKAIFDSL